MMQNEWYKPVQRQGLQNVFTSVFDYSVLKVMEFLIII